MNTNWPTCTNCSITTNDLVNGRCADPKRCVLVVLQRAQVLSEALAKVSRRLFGATPQEEFELERVSA